MTTDTGNCPKYLELARRVCKIAGASFKSDEQIDSILERLKTVKQTPYFTSTQRGIRELLGEIIGMIQKIETIEKIEKKISQLQSDVEYDIYWD